MGEKYSHIAGYRKVLVSSIAAKNLDFSSLTEHQSFHGGKN